MTLAVASLSTALESILDQLPSRWRADLGRPRVVLPHEACGDSVGGDRLFGRRDHTFGQGGDVAGEAVDEVVEFVGGQRSVDPAVREIGSFQEGKAPMLAPTVRRVLSAFEQERGPAASRDRALLLLGLAGGYRVSELASLRVNDVDLVDEGAIVVLRSSKTDQAGGGFYKGIPYGHHAETCPVSHLGAWLALLPTSPDGGPLFTGVDRHGNLSGRLMAPDSVSRVVKKRAQKAGLDPSRYSGHSLRAGLVTAASEGGAHDKDIMRQTAHRSLSTLHRYRRTVGLFIEQPRLPPRPLTSSGLFGFTT